MAMIANNLSTLGVSAAQMDNTFDTQSYMLQWLPTTGEFGLWGTFGDFDFHEKLATRLAVHYTSSTEDKQSQPGTDGIENTPDSSHRRQLDLHAGSVRHGHHRPASEVPDVERGRRPQVQGPVVRSGVLLALAERLRGDQHLEHPGHQRSRLSTAGLGDGRAEAAPGLLRQLRHLRPLRQSRRRCALAPTSIPSSSAASG